VINKELWRKIRIGTVCKQKIKYLIFDFETDIIRLNLVVGYEIRNCTLMIYTKKGLSLSGFDRSKFDIY